MFLGVLVERVESTKLNERHLSRSELCFSGKEIEGDVPATVTIVLMAKLGHA